MRNLKNLLKKYCQVLMPGPSAKYKTLAAQYQLLREQNRFMLYQLQRINEMMRYQLLGDTHLATHESQETRASFDYQWHEFPDGVAMPNDAAFMREITALLCQITALPAEWFPGKHVVDIGCGAGRFSYGLLSLGAHVTSCDQSPWALQRTTELCQQFGERFSTQPINLLEWTQEAAYDLAFCFGVVHHTGNTYRAIRNVARKVKPGGRLFLMIYSFPDDMDDLENFAEINAYEALRYASRHLSLPEKKQTIMEQYGAHLGHGWFDAASPQINDLLNFSEIVALLQRVGFHHIQRTRDSRHHHVIADKM
jgi:2-polyprenyl-3-methyl-5-hydroxy-6-metoxy-1,4-benzoquinol methylase